MTETTTTDPIFSKRNTNDNEFIEQLKLMPQGTADGAELTTWTDAYFVKKFMNKKPRDLPTLISLKSACFNIIRFFCGQTLYYEGVLKDMESIIIHMRHPSDHNKFLFAYMLTGSTISTGIQDETKDVDKTAENTMKDSEGESISTTSIELFWRTIHGSVSSISAQGSKSHLAGYMAANVLGFICMHTLKLISRDVASVQRSMNYSMSNQYSALYRDTSFTIKLVSPCARALENIKNAFYNRGLALNLLSPIICRSMIERAETIPDDSVFGVLYGSCLLHVSMYGMAPIKYFEQAARACGLKNSEFALMINTSLVRESLLDIKYMMAYSNRSHITEIMGKTYSFSNEMSWRYSRLYNNSNFNQFSTQKNLRIILRCISYIAARDQGSQIENMMILRDRQAKLIYNNEKIRAAQFIADQVNKNNVPITQEDKTLYGRPQAVYSAQLNIHD